MSTFVPDRPLTEAVDGRTPAIPAVTDRAQAGSTAALDNDQIGGMSTLRGLMVYAAVIAFAGLYVDFMVVISDAKPHTQPAIAATLISAAAALSGVLGSAFALKVGIPPSPAEVNRKLAAHLGAHNLGSRIHKLLSLEPESTSATSWPLTFGIWVYALIASATVIVYILNQDETPGTVKALAVTFGGYVIALLTSAYGLSKSRG